MAGAVGSAPADQDRPAEAVSLEGPPTTAPETLAELHTRLTVGARVTLNVPDRDRDHWSPRRLIDVIVGAGFRREGPTVSGPDGRVVTVARTRTLPDRVAPDLRVLMCGLNPSVYSADVGTGFARPGNRFWPAALAAGLVGTDRDPTDALRRHGIGMTDLVKRATPRADVLRTEEYRSGLARVTRLCWWMNPAVVCFVGLSGWRAAVDRHASAGWQPTSLGASAVYVMPSTSGLNAHATLAALTDHLRTAAAGPDARISRTSRPDRR